MSLASSHQFSTRFAFWCTIKHDCRLKTSLWTCLSSFGKPSTQPSHSLFSPPLCCHSVFYDFNCDYLLTGVCFALYRGLTLTEMYVFPFLSSMPSRDRTGGSRINMLTLWKSRRSFKEVLLLLWTVRIKSR